MSRSASHGVTFGLVRRGDQSRQPRSQMPLGSAHSPVLASTEGGFRPDLEALRGVAVLLVLLYHVGFSAIGGGFVGVDVFFVLSGYFMARTLDKTDRASILRFFDRRIRRVIPLTLVVAIAFMVAMPWLFLPHEVRAVTADFVGVMLMIPNMVYWTDVGYFAKELFHPLLHYWSLGVEYQYYLVFPLLLMAFHRYRFAALVLLAMSLVLCVVLTPVNARTAFFMLPPRLWEFLLGWFAFRWVDQSRGPMVPTTPSLAIGVASVAVIGACAVLYDGSMLYPGHWAIWPTLATFALIVTGACAPVLAGPMAAPLRYLGKVSFSVYIVHYPLIFIAKYAPFYQWKVLGLGQKAGLVVASIVLAHFTHRWIELPFRSRSLVPGRSFYTAMAALSALAVGVVAYEYRTEFQIARHDPVVQKITLSVQERGSFRCGRMESLDVRFDSCELVAGQPGRPRVLALGNSHVDSLKETLIQEAQWAGSALFMTKNNCLLGAGRKCAVDATLAEIGRRDITDVIFHAYVDEHFDYGGLEHLVGATRATGVRVHLIDPVPIYAQSVPAQLYFAHAASASHEGQVIDRGGYRRAYDNYLHRTREITRSNPHVRTYATVDIFCNPRCRTHEGYRLFYFDSNHLTHFGAEQLAPVARTILARAPAR